jgi:hypothetical protein
LKLAPVDGPVKRGILANFENSMLSGLPTIQGQSRKWMPSGKISLLPHDQHEILKCLEEVEGVTNCQLSLCNFVQHEILAYRELEIQNRPVNEGGERI